MYQFIKKMLATKNSCNLLGRKTFKLLMSFSLVISSFIFVGCPGPDPASRTTFQFQNISEYPFKVWVNSVTVKVDAGYVFTIPLSN